MHKGYGLAIESHWKPSMSIVAWEDDVIVIMCHMPSDMSTGGRRCMSALVGLFGDPAARTVCDLKKESRPAMSNYEQHLQKPDLDQFLLHLTNGLKGRVIVL